MDSIEEEEWEKRCNVFLGLSASCVVKRKVEESLTINSYIVYAFPWDETKQGRSFWTKYTLSRPREENEGREILRNLLSDKPLLPHSVEDMV